MTERVLRHLRDKLGPCHKELLRFCPHVLDKRLKHLEEDARPQGKGHLQHLDFCLAGADRERVVLYEHAGEGAYFEGCAFDGFIHAVELLKLGREGGARLFLLATTQEGVEDLGFLFMTVLAVQKP